MMKKVILNLKNFAGKNWQLIALGISVILLIFSYAGCGNQKGDAKECEADLEKCKTMYTALDTAHFELTQINAANESKLREIPIPQPVTAINDNSGEVQALREQVQRNKLKQVEITGNCEADKENLQSVILEYEQENDRLFNVAQTNSDSVSLLLSQLNEARKNRTYQDSIQEDNYKARYTIDTRGELSGFKLAVDPVINVITRTVASPAPDPIRYSYMNNIKLIYEGGSTWDTKYFYVQKAGIEYERTGIIGARLGVDYLIDTKDFGATGTIYLRPFRWGKKEE